jgi:imidazolonepropionase-like amidohydrolase
MYARHAPTGARQRIGRLAAASLSLLVVLATVRPHVSRAAPSTAPPADAAPRAATLAFVDVNVVPMDSDRVLEHQNVVIRGDRIAALGPMRSTKVPPGATRVDGRGHWLMPGLIDLHVHLNDPDDGILYVANGVTTIRSMWGFPETLEWRKEFASGKRLGPTVYTTGPILDGKPPIWPGSAVIETADDAEREIAAEKAAGYDFVKVYSRLSRTAYAAILAAAKRHGMRVVGHVPDSVGVLGALDARGQESIEHLTGYLTAVQTDGSRATKIADWNEKRRELVSHIDESKIAPLARRTRAAGVWNCVTLTVGERFSALEHRDSLLKLPMTRYEPPEVLASWDPAKDFRLHRATQEDFAAMRASTAFQMRMTRALRDAGAGILLGTDTSNPFVVAGFSAHDELGLLVKAGLTPYEALRAGTSDAAAFLHASKQLGGVATGLRADLVLVDGNPLEDVRAAARRSGVVLRGRWMPARELDAELDKLATQRATPSR